MTRAVKRPFREISFVGGRFDDAAGFLDVDVLDEFRVYRKIVVETAKELWRQKNRDRPNLPPNFEKGFRPGISGEIGEGSVRVSIARTPRGEGRQLGLDLGTPDMDIFDEAAELMEQALVALQDDKLFPKGMTTPALREFEKWGKSLTGEESIILGTPGNGVTFDAKIRERLTDRLPKPYFDTLDLTGEVRAADLKKNKPGGSFKINLDYHSDAVYGKFTDEQEAIITEALHSHDTVRLKFRALCEYRSNGEMRRIAEIQDCEIVREETSDPASLLRIFDKIHKTTPESVWANLPTDGARNYKHYLYGFPKEGEE